MVLWNGSALVMMSEVSPERALFCAKLLQLGLILAPLGLFTTSVLIARKPIPKLPFGLFCALHVGFVGSLFLIGSSPECGGFRTATGRSPARFSGPTRSPAPR